MTAHYSGTFACRICKAGGTMETTCVITVREALPKFCPWCGAKIQLTKLGFATNG